MMLCVENENCSIHSNFIQHSEFNKFSCKHNIISSSILCFDYVNNVYIETKYLY